MEVEFGWVGVQSHFHVKSNSVEVVLRLCWGCDNNATDQSMNRLFVLAGFITGAVKLY